jgi:membrane-anchored protein YejM (alkaline phosphatase superfamily)
MYQLPTLTNGISKSQLKIMADMSLQEIFENGKIIEAAEALSVMETFIKELRGNKQFSDYVREEISKNGKQLETNSAKIELAETGIKYSFDNCGDVIYEQLNQQLESIEQQLKDRKEFLKTVSVSGLSIINEQTGEVSTIYPPSKQSTSTYKITLKK